MPTMHFNTEILIKGIPELYFDRSRYSADELIELYEAILLPRMVEEKMLILLRQNKISKWFSGIGQEAVSVGIAQAIQPQDYVFPLHRNLGIFTGRGMPLEKLFAQWQGKPEGYTKGRDRSFHFASVEDRVIGMISHLGAMLGVADGVALAAKLSNSDHVAVAFSGDGGASEGDFHEALNVAAVWDLPVLFVVENNGYGLSTPSSEQFRCAQFIDKGMGYGMRTAQVKGNNLLEVHSTVKQLLRQMRVDRKPILLECLTFRMRGHEEASGTKYVPKELMDAWEKKDPVKSYEAYLLKEGVLTDERVAKIREAIKGRIQAAWDLAFDMPDVTPTIEQELGDVYAKAPEHKEPQDPSKAAPNIRFVDAISQAMDQAMEQDDKLVLMGQDIAGYGGVFKVTQGLMEKYGKERVRNTPLCESAILAAGMGLTLEGYRAMVEMQFADFVSCGFNQIVNNLAKTHYRWGHAVPVVVRMPTGAGVAAGPFHSQSNEAWFFKVPGLKVVYPSSPHDAKGLLMAALQEPNPVLFFEHKVLYRSISGPVPEEAFSIPIGKARVVKPGSELSIITYGMGVHWALQLQEAMPEADIEIVDLRSLLPWDEQTVFASVRKTGKALVLHEDTVTGGIGAELAASIQDACYMQLDGPVKRVGSLDTPVPFNPKLEQQFLANARLRQAAEALLNF